jgi:hypothetical protein
MRWQKPSFQCSLSASGALTKAEQEQLAAHTLHALDFLLCCWRIEVCIPQAFAIRAKDFVYCMATKSIPFTC